jgi:hypothetical protein
VSGLAAIATVDSIKAVTTSQMCPHSPIVSCKSEAGVTCFLQLANCVAAVGAGQHGGSSCAAAAVLD